MQLKKLTRYTPSEKPFGDSIQYFQSDDGQDFYSAFALFTKRYKLCVNPSSGLICAVDEDVSRLYPAGFNVEEIDELPNEFNLGAGWSFVDGEIVAPTVNYAELAITEKGKLQKEADNTLAVLNRAVRLKIATDEEVTALEAWERYSVELWRVDTSLAPDIVWPTVPA